MLKNTYASVQSEPNQYLAPREWISWLILSLRFLALTLALLLSFFDRSQVGVIIPISHMTIAAVAYNVILVLLARYVRWLRQTLNVLVLDTLMTTLAVYLTGGYHSGFFIIYFFIIIGAAFYLNLLATTIVSLVLALIYVGACFVNPAGIWTANAAYILAGKVVLLLIVALTCALLLEQLRREHRETERERALSARLSALNDLFEQLSASLDVDRTMQTVVEAPRDLLGADASMILLRRDDEQGLYLAASSGLGLDPDLGELFLDDREFMEEILNMSAPYGVEDLPAQAAPLYSLLDRHGIVSLAAVALVLDSQRMGLLCAGRRTAAAFSEDDSTFLNALAREAAMAIRNARLYERERQQVQELRTLEALQASFVSAVSHELRTPLTCIKTSVDVLEDMEPRDVPEVRREVLQTIIHHTGRLEALVKDLLDATRLEAGQLTLSTQPTDLRLLIERTVSAFAPLVEKKEQVIELDLPKAVGVASLDRHRVEQVLTNLISNASKFTPKRGHIRVSLKEAEEYLELVVQDDGPGIPPGEQIRIFEKFYVVADGPGPAGVGLGLYITRQLVELHGGHIWVESTPSKGSTFHVTIPKESEGPYPVTDLAQEQKDPAAISGEDPR